MKFYFAPLEGISGHIYRNAYHDIFGNIDKYFAPFIVPNKSRNLKGKELKDILPENNVDINLVPQILTNKSEGFMDTCKKLKLLGYNEVNINLGCPSGTVVSKFRGSGFLAKRMELDRFFYKIFEAGAENVSVKTRIGKEDPEEMYELMKIYNKYPLKELIIHPRVQTDYYKGTPNLEVFKDALESSVNPVCYNGDIFTVEDYKMITEKFPQVDRVMLGRGILRNPGIITQIKNGKNIDKEQLKSFHDRLYNDYKRVLSGDKHVLFKMKELWFYMGNMFQDSDKYIKKIRKSQDLVDYNIIVASIFRELELI